MRSSVKSTATIVCGVDHSPNALVAARFAKTLAERLALRIVLIHAVQPPIPQYEGGMPVPSAELMGIEQLRDAGVALLEKIKQELGSDCEITTEVRIGGASDVIAAVAGEAPTEFVVVGSRGLGSVGKLILGSVSLRLAARGPCPTVMVPDSAGTIGDGPIMCAVDDSKHSRWAMAAAAKLAERLDVKLILAHAEHDDTSSSSYGLELLARLVVESGLGTSVERILVRGEPAEAIVEAAGAHGAEMIVIGSRGRGALASSVLGSVSSAVATRSTCPVTILRAPPARVAAERSAEEQ
jgi:nucleotide-binding universal stress UspA family protein